MKNKIAWNLWINDSWAFEYMKRNGAGAASKVQWSFIHFSILKRPWFMCAFRVCMCVHKYMFYSYSAKLMLLKLSIAINLGRFPFWFGFFQSCVSIWSLNVRFLLCVSKCVCVCAPICPWERWTTLPANSLCFSISHNRFYFCVRLT